MSLTAAERTLAEAVVKASTSRLYKKVFFLGPYARRVSFASQQNRALNLVWALDRLERVNRSAKVAVIGGGLSGVTACFALAELGYRPYLFERGSSILNRQVSAHHRYIHPTINRWPGQHPTPTTSMPYFDWISGICTELLRTLRKEWSDRHEALAIELVEGCSVKGFSEGKSVAVLSEDQHRFSDERFSFVIVTSGFADETTAKPDLKTYWMDDGLEATLAGSAKIPKFFISGCGDGGLIDALRVAHSHFEEGRLVIQVGQSLTLENWPHAARIKDAEAVFDTDSTALLDAIRNGSQSLEKVYRDAAEDLAGRRDDPQDPGLQAISRTLHNSLRRSSAGCVTLISTETCAFNPMSAPIHKLLIAHAMNDHVIAHRCGFVADYDAESITYHPQAQTPAQAAATPARIEMGKVIVRHGAGPNFNQFFADDPEAAEQLKQAQQLMAAEFDRPAWREGEGKLKHWPPKLALNGKRLTGKDRARLKDEVDRRDEQAQKIVALTPGLRGSVSFRDDVGFVLRYRETAGSAEALKSLPDELFGFPLRPLAEDQVEFAIPFSGATPPRHVEALRIGPGTHVTGSTNGRLGPILVDGRGGYFALTAKHVLDGALQCPSENVLDGRGRRIGVVAKVGNDEEDIGLVAIDRPHDLDLSYGRFSKIVAAKDDASYGTEAVIADRGGVRRGYVSATDLKVGYTVRRPVVANHLVRISPQGRAAFAQQGDSGAPVVDSVGSLIGIVLCGHNGDVFVKPIQAYLDANGLHLASEVPRVPAPPRDSEMSESSDMQQQLARMVRAALSDGAVGIHDDTVEGLNV